MVKKKKDGVKAAVYLFPALISIFIFVVLPMIYTIYMSFTNYDQFTQGSADLVGFSNYIDVLTGDFSKVFIPVFLWTLVFAIAITAGSFIVGLLLAMVLNNPNIKEAGIYKAILILPWALPVTVAILSWQGLLNGNSGTINVLLQQLHIIEEPIKFLTDPLLARISVILVSIWLGFPYMMNVCLGSLAAIPDTYYEAAEIDGASKFTQFMKITLPSLAQTAYPLLITSFAFNFNNFSSAYLITEGNPPKAGSPYAGYTDILASTNYKLSTVNGKYAIGATLSILVFIVLATISYVQMKASGQFEEVN
ncbi:Maltose transport system permease protein MalF [Clostridium bornimense]|uniref:Maltose/maltodextrin transport system permease protein n=1 Tax=Clostridium bornimense TaxID=1216932 RepID=W6RZW2_9CLOT|nr:sugar ABC transporter permease [Clostridium bornimense]CDM69154.1 Maltose transport system permease protein MalF [Clostridium bornimense]